MWLTTAREALRKGELLAAFDAASNAVAAENEIPAARYVQVLALARMGELSRAQRMYDEHLAAVTDDLDTLALRARLAKDRALCANAPARAPLMRVASEAYAAVFLRTGDTFPGINAATLSYLAGDRTAAEALAHAVLDQRAKTTLTSYYDAATVAEAHLLLGHAAEAIATVELAMTLPGCDHGARSSTSRQFRALEEAGAPAGPLIERLRPPPVMAFCGHLFVSDPEGEARLHDVLAKLLDRTGISFGYGALACGADIVIAESLLAHGGELHVVLPFRIADFIAVSVAVGGAGWVDRFNRCLDRASEVVIASEASAVGDDRQFEYGSLLAMGYARLRAGHLGTRAVQLAVWDEHDHAGLAGTAADVRRWRRHGGETLVVPLDRSRYLAPPRDQQRAPAELDRAVRAMIFADFAGFSRIDERLVPEFWRTIMVTAAKVIDGCGAAVRSRNSWGDALFIVVDEATTAALLALDLQAALKQRLGHFGPGTGMRVSAHIGSVYEAYDPITRATTFYGHEVNKAARIEPITSVGEIYVSRAFAALLEMEAPGRFDLSYAGQVALSKNFGTIALYRLSRFPANPTEIGED